MTGYEKAMEYLHSFNCHYRNMAIVWFKSKGKTVQWIARETKLAFSTVQSYIYKFNNLLHEAFETFQDVLEKVKQPFKEYYNHGCYILHITTDHGEFTKIGKSKDIDARVTQIKKNGWKRINVLNVDIIAKFNCYKKAEKTCLEDALRTAMIHLNPDYYIENDRLLGWEDDYGNKIINYPLVQATLQEWDIPYELTEYEWVA